MPGELQDRNVGIEVHAVNAFTLEGGMLIQYSVDVRHRYLLEVSLPQDDTMPNALSGGH